MKRRALSTVVGAVFFVIVMASTISYVAYSMDLIDNLARSVDVKQDENLNRQNEKFEISSVKIESNNKFNITLHNSGNIPVKITRLYVENTTDSLWNATKYDVNTQIAPGETKHSIASNLPLNYVDTESYLFSLVTERGNNEKVSVNSGGNQVIHTNLYALPDVIPMGFNTVLLYEVINNSTGQLVNIVPVVNESKICTSCTWTANGGWQPAYFPSLKPGEVTTFQKSYTLDGDDGDIFLFNASLQNAYPGVWDEERVDLAIVSEASQAGVSITAQGIGAAGSDPLSLFLHEETDDTPNSAYQMASTKADAGNDGLVITLDTSGENDSWFTNNSTQTIFIDGTNNWVAALRYKSDQVPPTLVATPPDLIFYFDDDNYPTSIRNSQGDPDRDLEPCPSRTPTESTGVHNTPGYDFNGAQCFQSSNVVAGGDENDISTGDDATAFWFKTNGAMSGANQYFVNFEGSGSNPEYYRIYMTDPGKIVFTYKSKHPSDIMTCTSTNEYDNSAWHHVVAVRSEPSSIATCELYIDKHTGSSETVSNTAGNFDNTISTDGRWTVGSNKAQTGNFFNGDMDVIMHWDNHRVTLTEATDLAQTNYGLGAHKLGFEIIKTRYDGTPHQSAPYPYATTFIPFHDPMGKLDTDDSAYGNFNYTMNLPDVNLDPVFNHRLNFTMKFESSNSTWNNLGFDLKIDDENITPFTSYIQLPDEPTNPIPGYLTFDNDDPFQFFFENGGDRGFRFTFAGTRIVFNSTSTGIAYGGIPASVNGTNIDEAAYRLSPNEDSIHFPGGSGGHIWFWDARTVPSHSPSKGTLIPPGTYRGAVWVIGYDDEGLSFEKTFDLGIVTIVE